MEELFKGERVVILDGAMGTMLQAVGLAPGAVPESFNVEQPEKLTAIHRAYVQAGSQILCANTFGANRKKLAGSGISVQEAVAAGVACAKNAAAGMAKVALDVGPLGEMLEPGGTLAFEDAYDAFCEVMRAGAQAGADVIMIETMTDLYETKAAVLAARECTKLPVMVSMTFEADGRTFAGVPVEGFAAAVSGLGAAALGINCSLGPAEVMPVLRRLCDASPLPVYAMPNAGLPDPVTGAWRMTAQDFCEAMHPCLAMGVSMVGGCCGTTPETIRLLKAAFGGKAQAIRKRRPHGVMCGATAAVGVGCMVPIGERINPTGKKRLREALLRGDLSAVQTLAVEQQQAGAQLLDVNVGAPGVDEVTLLPAAVKAVQAVCGLPLQLDSANVDALAAALRVCCGKPAVNSTSGEEEKMAAVLPLCAKYGAAVVGLTLDESGIPDTAEERLRIAEKIVAAAAAHGIPEEDVWIDCLTLSVGAQPDAGLQTLRAVRLVREKLGVNTVLGVSNVSFGLPNRPLINRTFLAMALQAGLNLPILNPSDEGMMGTLAAFRLLAGQENAADAFVRRCGEEAPAVPAAGGPGEHMELGKAVERGLKQEAADAARRLLEEKPGQGLALVEKVLVPALDEVGRGFEENRVFLPQLLSAAGAAQAAFAVVRAAAGGREGGGPPVVVATVRGDVHDIGKNIAKTLLENYGFTVIDLGRDVPPAQVVDATKKSGARLVGLSALMTTTLAAMEETVRLLRSEAPGVRVMLGGAVLTEEYVAHIGGDKFVRNAKASVDYARLVYKSEMDGKHAN